MNPMPQQVGRYRILSEVGRGAMGVVYRAHDPQLDRQIAVKLISVSMAGGTSYGDEELEGRFLREARVAARLQHPNVVAVYDAGREGRDLFLVMELIEGESLADRLARGPQPTVLEALEMIAQAADALGAAHSANVIHRDIKPANLLITRDGRVKVSDFGVAKAIGEGTELTRTGTMVGSPAYMAPEQIRGQQLDGRSDLFSLGVVLYEMLLRRKPFPADTVTSLVYQILHEDPLSDPGISTSLLGPDLTALLRWCLAKKPEDRIPDARTFSARARAIVAKASSADAEARTPTQLLATAPLPGSTPTRPAAIPLAGALAGGVAGATSGRAPALEASSPTAIRPTPPEPPAGYDLPPTRIVSPPTLPPPPPAMAPPMAPPQPPAARSETAASYAPTTKPAWWWVVAAAVVLIGVGVAFALLRHPTPPAIGQSEPPTATVTPEVPAEVPAPKPAAAPFTAPTGQPLAIQTATTSPPAATMPPVGTPTAQSPAPTPVTTATPPPAATPTAPTTPQPWKPQPVPSPTPTPPPSETAPATPEPAKDASKEKGKDEQAAKEDEKGKDKSSEKEASGGDVAATFKCRESAKFSFSPDEAHVIVNGHDIGTADDWDDMGGGKLLKLKDPGSYRVELKLKGYKTTVVELVVDPKAKEKVCDVDTDLEEND